MAPAITAIAAAGTAHLTVRPRLARVDISFLHAMPSVPVNSSLRDGSCAEAETD